LQFGVDPSRRLELEAAGARSGDGRAIDSVARQQVADAAGFLGGLSDPLAAKMAAK